MALVELGRGIPLALEQRGLITLERVGNGHRLPDGEITSCKLSRFQPGIIIMVRGPKGPTLLLLTRELEAVQ